MADRIQAFKVSATGGMNTNRDVLLQGNNYPGSATQLINYEPSITGGYRRISGYSNDYGTVPGTGKVLGVAVSGKLNDSIFACRAPVSGNDYFYKWNSNTSSWVAITTPSLTYTGVNKVRIQEYTWADSKLILTDGVNPAATYDGTSYVQLNGSFSPAAPKYASAFKNHMFFAGDPSEPYNVYFSSPLDEGNFNPAVGAGVINVGFEVVQLKQFRDTLYIFGKNQIKSLVGNSIADWQLNEVTTNLGCLIPDSIIEIGGDLLFFGPDGYRPISGTSKIGDVQLETVSKQIQFTTSALILELIAADIDPEEITSVVIRKKSQFRMLFPHAGSFGILGGLRQNENGISYEFMQLYDIHCTCAASGYVGIDEFVIHGDSAGKVYRQESGMSFDNNPILSVYQTPYYYFEDPTIRKNFYNITTFLRSEGSSTISFNVQYDFEDDKVFNPSNYAITTEGAAAYYNEAIYDANAVYDGNPAPVRKTNISGSGFSVSFRYVTNDTNASHTIQGFVLNYSVNDRR